MSLWNDPLTDGWGIAINKSIYGENLEAPEPPKASVTVCKSQECEVEVFKQ